MQSFVAVVAKQGRRIPPEISRRIARDTPRLLFEPAATTSWSNPSGSVLVRAWAAPNRAFGIERAWTDGTDGITAITGHLWPRGGGWDASDQRGWAEQLADLRRRHAVDALIERLAGVYTALSLDADGRGACWSDPLGLGLLYTGETRDYVAVSGRADLAAWAIAPERAAPARDPIGVAWLPYAGHIVGDRTGFAGVRTVPQGSYIEIRPDEGARALVWTTSPWVATGTLASASPDELVDAVRRDIADLLHVALALPAPRKVAGLTGGRDTRLILAVMLSEGLTDGVTFRTLGDETLPDVQVARSIAEHFGLEHEWGIGTGRANGARTPRAVVPYEERVRSFVDDTAGMLNIWDGGRRVAMDDTLNISGLCGEIMNTHFAQTANVDSPAELERRFLKGWRFGDPGLMRDDVRAALQAEAHDELFEDRTGGATPVELIDVFFLRNRLRRWTGTEQEVDATNRVFPLYTLDGMRAAFTLGDRRRRAMYLHAMVIRETCPELVTWPFAGPGWPDPAALGLEPPAKESSARWRRARRDAPPEAGQPARAVAPAGAATKTATGDKSMTANQLYQARTLDEKQRVLRSYLVDDPRNPVFDVVDRARTLDAFEHMDELDLQRRIRLFGAATAAIWLAGE